MRRWVAFVGVAGMVAILAACGEDTQYVIPKGPLTTTTRPGTTAAEPASRWSSADLDELCRSWEREFMNEPAPDRQAHVDKLLRAITRSDEWATLSVEERRQVEATARRALDGDC